MEINGIAHVQLTVNDLERCTPFYEEVLGFMGMRAVVKAANFLYMIGGRTAVAITRSSEENRRHRFDQRRIGLHHLCFRARSREDVDELYRFLLERISSLRGGLRPSGPVAAHHSCRGRMPLFTSALTTTEAASRASFARSFGAAVSVAPAQII